MFEAVLRKLARDQWVRLHGTPRVTVLVGGGAARELWERWVALSGLSGTLLAGDFDEGVREALAHATAEPAKPIAILASAEAAAAWRAGRQDRLAAMVDEGWVELPDHGPVGMVGAVETTDEHHADASGGGGARDGGAGSATVGRVGAQDVHGLGRRATHVDARSVAEAALFEALEATPATAGRFALNESLSVRFGAAAAEVDLLSRGDRIAVEIDGFHHFADLDGYRRDRKKDVLLQAQGLFVVRVLAEDVMRDVRGAVNVVTQAIAYRLKEHG